MTYNGLLDPRYLFTTVPVRPRYHGSQSADGGRAPYQNNIAQRPDYNNMVPKTDADGNDITGRAPADGARAAQHVPGWAQARGSARDDGCGIGAASFPTARLHIEASGRSRLSIEGISFTDYYYRVRRR